MGRESAGMKLRDDGIHCKKIGNWRTSRVASNQEREGEEVAR